MLIDDEAWDKLVLDVADGSHYMQSSVWAATKAHSQWPVSRIVPESSNTPPLQVFSRTVPGLGLLHYAPEVAGVTPENIPAITKQIRDHYRRGLAFKLELYLPYSDELLGAFKANGWVRGNSVQPRDTVLVDLARSEEELFNSMKRRARYEVRVAQRNKVRVEKPAITQANLDKLSKLIDITGERSGAFFRKHDYRNRYWQAFAKANQGSLYFAYHDKDLLAAAYVIRYGKSAWYKDGGSVRDKSNLMGSRFLQWEIMRDLQTQGINRYDQSGIPAKEELETSSLKGLYTFKTGFAPDTVKLMPAVELPLGKRYPLWPKAETQFLRLYSGLRKDFWY